MAAHNETGNEGEQLAADYLIKQGFTILHRNWRWGHREVDIIANKNGKIHFIEVKTRSSTAYGYPETSVNKEKLLHIMRCAVQFLNLNPTWKRIEFNILSITLKKQGDPEYFWMEDVHL